MNGLVRRSVPRAVSLIAASLCASCTPEPPWNEILDPSTPPATRHTDPDTEDVTRSPSAVQLASPLAPCSVGDAALQALAETVVKRASHGEPSPSQVNLTRALRRVGSPYVWPRAWIVRDSRKPDGDWSRFRDWAGATKVRCGVAEDGNARVVIAVDALADLKAVPRHAHVGRWLDLEAELGPRVRSAQAHLVGPDGVPRTLPTANSGSSARARFAPERAGLFTLQWVGDTEQGPRPILEAEILVDVGEVTAEQATDAHTAGKFPEDVILASALEFRKENARGPLTRDPDLDAVAREHVVAMVKSGIVGHDAGDGDPAARVARRGIVVSLVGENVAHAKSAALAHEEWTRSPSHRANLLRPEFTHIGIATAKGDDDTLWAVELFVQRQSR